MEQELLNTIKYIENYFGIRAEITIMAFCILNEIYTYYKSNKTPAKKIRFMIIKRNVVRLFAKHFLDMEKINKDNI